MSFSQPLRRLPAQLARARIGAAATTRCIIANPTTRRTFASKPEPAFSVVESCPSPTCACTPTPPMPEGLDIDHKTPLGGLCPSYAEQVLICTGNNDWPSKMEEESGGDNLAADLKELMGRGGVYNDPFHNVLVTNSSLPSTPHPRSELQSSSAYLLPSFKYVPYLPRISFDAVTALVKGYLLPQKLNPAHDGLSPIHKDRLTRSEAYQSLLPDVRDVNDVLVLICGHGGRDMRCGVLGPVLQKEFEEKLEKEGFDILRGPVEDVQNSAGEIEGEVTAGDVKGARVGVISHIGGHKFAGNVIIYLPPGMKLNGHKHPLAGYGIWYGRVETQHVEGLVRETVVNGKVVKDKLRGGIDPDKNPVRL